MADRVGAAVPEALTVALPESGGGLARNADDACRRWLGEATAIGVGPGLGRADGTQKVVRGLLAAYDGPAVVDADALFALGTGGPLAERRGRPWSPRTPASSPGSPPTPRARGSTRPPAGPAWGRRCCSRATTRWSPTPTGGWPSTRPGSRLATGGTGDVLTGLTGAARPGARPFDAGRLGAWVHGRAAALAVADLGPVSVAAGDVAEHLPGGFQELLGRKGAVTGAAAGGRGGRP